MAKAMTIQEKRKEMEKALKRLEAFEKIIGKLEDVMRYEYLIIKCDDEGKPIEDKDKGDWVYTAPTEEYWNYDEYAAFKAALDEIKAIV